jgi:hypothetical protein
LKLTIAAVLLLLVSCATPTPPATSSLVAPDWTAVPPQVLDALCGRLQIDAISGTSPLSLVSTTRPLANAQSINALALATRGRVKGDRIGLSSMEMNRSLPIITEGAGCPWRAVPVAQLDRHRDEMMVELSAPAINPFSSKSGGILARVTVGGEAASWYWITLVPRGGQWGIGPVFPLVH